MSLNITLTGIAGAQGISLHSGDGAPANSLGNIGDAYVDLGPAAKIYSKRSTGWTAGVSLIGGQGPQGSVILQTTGVPDSSVGRPGDYAIDLATAILYGPKDVTFGWSSSTLLRGPKGDTGTSGASTVAQITDAGAAGRNALLAATTSAVAIAAGLGNVNNTSDTTKAAAGNPVGDAIAAKFDKAGGTINGPIIVNGAAGTTRLIEFQTNGANRWTGYVDGVLENGANAGSDYHFGSYFDNGAYDDVYVAHRATRNVSFNYGLSARTLTYDRSSNLPSGFDLNTVFIGGFYDVYQPLNSPSGATASANWWYIEVQRFSNYDNGQFVRQRAYQLDGESSPYVRLQIAGVWKPWRKVFTDQNIGTTAGTIMAGDDPRVGVSPIQFGAISGTDPANAAVNTTAFTNALATGRRVIGRDEDTYIVNPIIVPTNASHLTGRFTLKPAPTMAEGSAILNITNNTAAIRVDGPTVAALQSITSFTGTVTAGSAVITAVTGASAVAFGQVVSGARIPAGAKVASIDVAGATVTLDQPAFVFPTGSISENITTYHAWDAISYSGSDGVTIINTTVNGRHGVVGSNSNHVNVSSNICNGYLVSAFESNCISGQFVDINQNDNLVYGDSFANYGVFVNGGIDVHVNDNTVRGGAVHPIHICGVSQSLSSVEVQDNIVQGSLNEGIYFAGTITDFLIQDNQLTLYNSTDNGMSFDASGGFTISSGTVSGNNIQGAGVSGLFFGEVNSPGSNILKILVTNNKIVNPNSSRDDGSTLGIMIYGAGAQYITVVNNDITNFTGRMRYNVGEVAGTDGAPSNNILGPNTGAAGTLGFANVIGAGSTATLSVAMGGTGYAGAAFPTFVPNVTWSGGAGVTISANTGSYLLIGKLLIFNCVFTISYTTIPTGINLSLPAGLASQRVNHGTLQNDSTFFTGGGYINATSSVMALFRYDGALPITASGQTISVKAVLEVV